MDRPFTWGDYFWLEVAPYLGLALIVGVLGVVSWIRVARARSRCRRCGGRLKHGFQCEHCET